MIGLNFNFSTLMSPMLLNLWVLAVANNLANSPLVSFCYTFHNFSIFFYVTYLYSTDDGITFRKAYANFYIVKGSLIYYPDKSICIFQFFKILFYSVVSDSEP